MVQFESRRRRRLARASVVGIRFEAVVEENVPVVFGISTGGTGQDQQPKQTEEADEDTEEARSA